MAELTRYQEFKRLALLAGPLMTAQLAQMGMGVTDAVMAGHYGAVDLAGVALAGSLMWPVMMLFMGCLQALTPTCLLYTSPSPRDGLLSRMPSSA